MSFHLGLLMLFIPFVSYSQNIYDTLKTVKMTAIANPITPSITIDWADDIADNTYHLYRKLRQDTTWGDPLISTGNQDTAYVDLDIERHELYEYRIVKETGNHLGYAYLFSGLDYIPPQKRGDILLLVEDAAVEVIEDNLTDYIEVLKSEGWRPQLEPVPSSATVQEVKSLILQYNQDLDSLSTVLLMGNIAVPHSGNINPDGHNDHKGAWPADVYYGDMNGTWTDETVNNVSSAYPRLHNIPSDGNFDQDFLPSQVELVLGRLDFSELPVFELDAYELLNRYLQKNIAYRTGQHQVKRQAVFKNRNPWQEGLGQNAIRNFVPLVSNDSLVYEDFFDAFYDSFLWSYGGSSGSMISSNSLGNINTYANNNFQAIFTAYFGSYYGDYDFENNYLRTILASGQVLSTAWVGAPNWYFHPMGLGLDLGFCTILTQNNTDLYYAGFFPQSVTINLLGDPTLKAYIVKPPKDLNVIQEDNHVILNWSPSADDIIGYQVYKKTEEMDYFEPIQTSFVTNTVFVDSCIVGKTELQYLVKAVKREITPSGSFINYSSGPMISFQTHPTISPQADFSFSWNEGILQATNLSTNATDFQWLFPDGTIITTEHFEIPYSQDGELNLSLMAANACFSDTLEQILVINDIINPVNTNDFIIYPNPTNDKITLEAQHVVNNIFLYNILGEVVVHKSNLSAGKHQINLEHLTTGIYLLKIEVENEAINRRIVFTTFEF